MPRLPEVGERERALRKNKFFFKSASLFCQAERQIFGSQPRGPPREPSPRAVSVAGALPSKKQRPRRIVNLPRVPVAVRRSSHAARGGARLVPFSHMPSAHAIAALSMAKLFVSKLRPGLRRSWSRLRRPSEIKIKVIYLVRHAEAMHNVEEKRVVGLSLEAGLSKSEADLARKTALETNDALKDAPLLPAGISRSSQRSRGTSQRLLDRTPYCAPEIVLVSPLRRTLQTATRLFGSAVGKRAR